MRTIVPVATFALATLTVAAAPANAWTCEGPEYVCGSPAAHHQLSKTRVSKSYDRVSTQRYAYKGESRRYAQAPARARRSYDYGTEGGSSAGGGIASYYASGSMTASGARFNPDGLTAAHRTLPFGTRVLVTNRSNGQSVVVTINDRGPFVGGRVIDLSRGAARAINMGGLAQVSLVVLGRS